LVAVILLEPVLKMLIFNFNVIVPGK
jgi:hypothetical protein